VPKQTTFAGRAVVFDRTGVQYFIPRERYHDP